MEFLDKLVLPQSAEHIELLHYITVLIFSLFVPFISIVFGGTFLSIFYDRKFRKEQNILYKQFSKDVIEYVTVNNALGVILGIVPILTSILIFTQLLHTSNINTVGSLSFSFVFITVALIMIYTYRHSMSVRYVFNSLDSKNLQDKDLVEEFDKLKYASSHLSLKYGKLGIVFLFIGIWFYVSAVTSVELFTTWTFSSIITSLVAPKVLLNFLIFICLAFALTAGAILFLHFYWYSDEKKQNPQYDDFIKDKISKVGLKFGLPLPLLIAINVFSLSEKTLSGAVFSYAVLAIFLLFLSYHLFFVIQIRNEYRFSSFIFFILIFASVSLIIKDQKAISNATEDHSIVLSTEYDKVLAELKGEGKTTTLSGKDIYDIHCASCHRFDKKLVGPAHFDVLPKYVGKEAQLVAFIRNPVKVNPEYPPMPNPGLKPQEADAVAKYMLEEYAKFKEGK